MDLINDGGNNPSGNDQDTAGRQDSMEGKRIGKVPSGPDDDGNEDDGNEDDDESNKYPFIWPRESVFQSRLGVFNNITTK